MGRDLSGTDTVTEVPVDPDVTALLAELGTPVPVASLTADELRQSMRDAIGVFTRGAAPIDVAHVEDVLVAGSGGPVPVRVYAPEQPHAVVAYLHGGGWVVGDLDTHDLVARRISRDTGATVVSVDYRMLPEHPFPAPFDDAWAAAVWASGLHPRLPFLVAGDSAGATLAASVALKARDEGGLRIDAQVLVYPGIDDDLDAASVLEFRDGPRVTRDDLRHYLDLYAASDAARRSPYSLPGRATSLEGLPPTVMVIAGHDPLRSSEEDHVGRLQSAGVPVTVQLDSELVHGWIDFAPRVPSADRAFTRLTDTINSLIHRGTTAA